MEDWKENVKLENEKIDLRRNWLGLRFCLEKVNHVLNDRKENEEVDDQYQDASPYLLNVKLLHLKKEI